MTVETIHPEGARRTLRFFMAATKQAIANNFFSRPPKTGARACDSFRHSLAIASAFGVAINVAHGVTPSESALRALLTAVAASDATGVAAQIADDAQLIYGERCTTAKPCLGRAAFLAALPPANEIRVPDAAAPIRTGNVWRMPLEVIRDGVPLAANAELYLRTDHVASLIIELRDTGTENRAAPARRKFDWSGILHTTAADLGITTAASREALKKTLREGGAAILCRHGNTNWAEQDVFGRHYSAEQRNERGAQRTLSDLGRAEGKAIGEALKQQGITIAAAYSTWWSRTREFGALIAGKETSETEALRGTPDITGATYQTLLNDAAKRPGVTILSAHNEPLTSMDVLRGTPFREGDCVVMKATSEKSFAVLNHLTPGQWAQLARP